MDDPAQTPALLDRFGKQPPEVMSELQSMLRIYDIDAQELFFKWESYCIKMLPEEVTMNLHTVRIFKTDVQNILEKEMRGKARMQQQATPSNTMRTPRPQNNTDVYGMLDSLTGSAARGGAGKRKLERSVHDTPGKNTRKYEPSSPQVAPSSPLPVRTPHKPHAAVAETSTPFSKRTNAGQTTEVLNPQISKPTLPLPDASWESRIRFLFNMEIKNFSYRPMYQKLAEASEVQDERIDEFAQSIQEHYQIRDEELGDPSVASPSEIVAVGRIVSDSLEGRLNAQSVLLESSRMTGGGARTPLKLDAVSSFAFFPGQIVAIRGTNSSGNYFAVTQILTPPQLPVASSSPDELAETAERLEAGPVSIFIASGPYTTDDNLLFESLDAICDKAAAQQPDVVILTGPFIDSEHPLVRDGDFDLETVDETQGGTLEDLFRERISRRIRRITNSIVILIPSLRDAVSKHLAYPQEGFRKKTLDLPPNAKCLPNPSMFSLNEIVFAVSTADILFHLSREETTRSPAETNPPARLTSHILTQRSFYPLFPPPEGEKLPRGVSSVSIDVPHSRLFDLVNGTPDVLLLPSALGGFAKVVEGVVAVNPGSCSKRMGAGTYVEMVVEPPKAAGGKEGVAHRVFERARVEVVRV